MVPQVPEEEHSASWKNEPYSSTEKNIFSHQPKKKKKQNQRNIENVHAKTKPAITDTF